MTAATPTPQGWVYGLPETEYHASPALSSSYLRTLIARSPAHARAALLEPHTETPALLLGRAVHCRVLEPDTYASRYAVAPRVDRRTGAGKAAWAEFVAAHPGATILTEADGALVEAIGAAVESHSLAPLLLSGGEAEVSGFFTDPETGVICRIRPDYLRLGDRLIADLKSTLDASPRAFQRAITQYGYHIQAAHYAAGFEVIAGEPLTDFLFVVVEKAPPYAVGIYRMDEAALDEGTRLLRVAMRAAADCLARGEWPGYSAGIEPVTLPAYAYQIEE